ncbi:hypothetical protein [Hyphomicrobium sp. DMF-1]|jgi:hypothetical protein|uniref:hypothetical protein n=1 Tax=Hyphomicrobium sp. DMF-1 TaxID=3019544 RepID=UPI0022EC0CFF|nr:hypothetical protein [Hyphomicrobium sp. DMF-1]WBT36373.1 hypothetical protein PE058_11960 [Hyphomicrobium sp. DMF-1]
MRTGNSETEAGALDDVPSEIESVAVARVIVETSEAERIELLHRLRRSFKLSRTVRGLNRLLDRPAHRPLGREALRRLGLEFAG